MNKNTKMYNKLVPFVPNTIKAVTETVAGPGWRGHAVRVPTKEVGDATAPQFLTFAHHSSV